jgi:hypothetical protein
LLQEIELYFRLEETFSRDLRSEFAWTYLLADRQAARHRSAAPKFPPFT